MGLHMVVVDRDVQAVGRHVLAQRDHPGVVHPARAAVAMEVAARVEMRQQRRRVGDRRGAGANARRRRRRHRSPPAASAAWRTPLRRRTRAKDRSRRGGGLVAAEGHPSPRGAPQRRAAATSTSTSAASRAGSTPSRASTRASVGLGACSTPSSTCSGPSRRSLRRTASRSACSSARLAVDAEAGPVGARRGRRRVDDRRRHADDLEHRDEVGLDRRRDRVAVDAGLGDRAGGRRVALGERRAAGARARPARRRAAAPRPARPRTTRFASRVNRSNIAPPRAHAERAQALGVLLVDRLAADAERRRDLAPRPALDARRARPGRPRAGRRAGAAPGRRRSPRPDRAGPPLPRWVRMPCVNRS